MFSYFTQGKQDNVLDNISVTEEIMCISKIFETVSVPTF